jgi:hypothetical protein
MLVCGRVNPPPVSDEDYNGVYFSTKDNVQAKVQALRGAPLRVEHNTAVGKVLNGWTDAQGGMWALAEIDTRSLSGAVTAAAVEKGRLAEFSLGYVTRMEQAGGRICVGDKCIRELSIVRKGAHDGCTIEAKTHNKKS